LGKLFPQLFGKLFLQLLGKLFLQLLGKLFPQLLGKLFPQLLGKLFPQLSPVPTKPPRATRLDSGQNPSLSRPPPAQTRP